MQASLGMFSYYSQLVDKLMNIPDIKLFSRRIRLCSAPMTSSILVSQSHQRT